MGQRGRVAIELAAVCAALLSGLYTGAARACDVCPSGCTHASIQAGIAAASPGDTLLVCPATYNENIDFLGKAITVVSRDGAETTIIDAGSSGSVVSFVSGEDASSILDGFTLRRGRGTSLGLTYGGGVYCSGAAPTLRNLEIRENQAAEGAGVAMIDCDAVISDSVIVGNATSVRDGGGLYVESSSPMLTDVTIENNSTRRNGGGIHAESSTLNISSAQITNNRAIFFSTGQGGGINLQSSMLTISDSSFTDNEADDFGGGLYGDSESGVSISGTTFADNSVNISGGGAYLSGGTPAITDSVFRGNVGSVDGGGLYLAQTGGSITDSLFIRNRTGAIGSGGGIAMMLASTTIDNSNMTENTAGVAGGGLWVANSSSPMVSNSLISFNTAGSDGGGVIVTEFSTPTFVNTVFHNNFLTGTLPGFGTGGALAVYSSGPVTLTNSTLRFNFATELGGGVYSEGSDVTITNSIVFGNTPDQIESFGASDAPVVTFSDVQGGYSGMGNIDATPMFVNLFNTHLRSGSPAIDAGTASGAPAQDIDGDARPVGPGIDMGADEFNGAVHPVPGVTANGMSGVVTIDRTVTPEVVFNFSLDSSGRSDPADWWVIMASPAGTFFLTLSALLPASSPTPIIQFPLFDLAGYDYPAIPLAGVPLGSYTVYFGVDTDQDGVLTWNDLYFDFVTVNVTE